jgi:hypothetical protein
LSGSNNWIFDIDGLIENFSDFMWLYTYLTDVSNIDEQSVVGRNFRKLEFYPDTEGYIESAVYLCFSSYVLSIQEWY